MARRFTAERASQLIMEGFSDSESDYDDVESDDSDSDDGDYSSEDDSLPDDTSTTANWTDAKDQDSGPHLLDFHSDGTSGPRNCENCETAMDYFRLFFTDDIIQDIVDEINRYADAKISNGELKPSSRLQHWRPTDSDEFKTFLGVLINMGIVRLPTVQMYWSTKWTSNVPFFRDAMSCNRFLLLYHTFLHVCHSDPSTNSGRGLKITPLLDKLVRHFRDHYEPFQEISVDESMIGFKGRLSFKMYSPIKPTKWGVMMRTAACPHTGYLLNAILYCGRDSHQILEEGISKTGQAVLDVVAPFSNRGHHVYSDRLYSSIALAENLYRKGFHYTGTIQLNRVGIPPQAKNVSGMRRGDISAFRRDNVLVLNWRDKRIVSMISTYSKGNETEEVNVRARQEPVTKPAVVVDYNKHMSGVDLHDQLNKYYVCSRKSVKWWKKVFFWILESCITNAWILRRLRTTNDREKMTLLKFRQELVEKLVPSQDTEIPKKRGRPSHGPPLQRLNGRFHSVSERNSQTRDCRVCSDRKHGIRRETKYFCETCTEQPPLHPFQCFKKYHTKRNYRDV